jgi:hypothetical protein
MNLNGLCSYFLQSCTICTSIPNYYVIFVYRSWETGPELTSSVPLLHAGVFSEYSDISASGLNCSRSTCSSFVTDWSDCNRPDSYFGLEKELILCLDFLKLLIYLADFLKCLRLLKLLLSSGKATTNTFNLFSRSLKICTLKMYVKTKVSL